MNAEAARLWALAFCLLAMGLITDNWLLAALVPISLMLAWQLFKLWQIESWLKDGAKIKAAPESSGLWESIVAQVLQLKARQKKHKTGFTKVIKDYRDTVLALPDAAIVLNEDLEIVWANEHAKHLLGIEFAQDQGYRITNLIRQPEFVQHLTSLQSAPLEIESPINQDLTLSIQVSLYGQDQRLLLARDISDRIRTRHALQHFVANASHELRTPLTVTSGYIDIIKDDPELPKHLQESVQQLRDKTDDMAELINDLLTLSKVEGGQFEGAEEQDVNVAGLIEDLLSDSRNGDHTFELKLDKKLGLRGIQSDIKSIARNLIENALKHTPEGSIIKVSWQQNAAKQGLLRVSDNGPGIDAAHIELITKRFYRINQDDHGNEEERKGSGLGLSIVKHSVMQHGGELQISSKPGQGAEFTAVFPASRCLKL